MLGIRVNAWACAGARVGARGNGKDETWLRVRVRVRVRVAVTVSG